MLVVFRVDASAQMGTGHVRRSLALAHALNDIGAGIVFITRALGVDSEGLIRGAGFKCITLPAPRAGGFTADAKIAHAHWSKVSSDHDAEETVSAAASLGPDWVVLDSYSFGAAWHDRVRDGLDCRIAQIDDLADRPLACDLVIDHNYAPDHEAKYCKVLRNPTQLLGGPRYALLAPSYVDAPLYDFSEEVHSVGVFMGGADPDNFTARALDALEQAGFTGDIEIVTTSANPNLASLQERIGKRASATLSVDLLDLAGFFARHDLHIGAGGGATWERCRIGSPTLAAICADNQEAVLGPLEALRVLDLHRCRPIDQSIMAQEIWTLLGNPEHRANLSRGARKLVDGQGARRVAQTMEAMSAS
ncbi:MAG: UDP-2,4-diacetamido-2,4,6-trideoxy-beta-L-altropyranose hydrolase [Pseudomonadota bacterium]